MDKKRKNDPNVFYFGIPNDDVKDDNIQKLNIKALPNTKKQIKQISETHPQGHLFEVIDAGKNNTWNLAKYSGYTYDFNGTSLSKPDERGTNFGSRLDNVASILPGKLELQKGDMVEVAYYDRNRQRPYIKRVFKRGFSTQVDGEEPSSPPVPLPVFETGMWLQQKGYWWQPNHNKFAIPRLDIIPDAVTSFTNQAMWKLIEYEGDTQGNAGTAVIFMGPVDFTHDWEVKKNGTVIKSGDTYPVDIPGVFFGNFTIQINSEGQPVDQPEKYSQIPSGIPAGIYNVFIFRETTHTGTYTATYKTKVKTRQVFRPSEIDDGIRKSLAVKGMCLFPDGGNQNIAVLTPHVEVEGSNYQFIEQQNNIEFVATEEEASYPTLQPADRFFLLGETPFTPPAPTIINFTSIEGGLITNFSYEEYDLVSIEDNTYALQVGMQQGRHPSFYYTYSDGTLETVDKAEEIQPDMVGYTIKPIATNNIYVDDVGPIETPGFEIVFLFNIFINGEQDNLATFSGDTITTSVEMQESDIVSFLVQGYRLNADVQTFESSTNQSEFEIDNNLTGEGQLSSILYFQQDYSYVDTTNYAGMCYIVPGTNKVRLYYLFSPGDFITVEYTTRVANGDYYKTSEIRIYEIGGNFSGQRILKTPVPSYSLNPLSQYNNDTTGERIVGTELAKYREGQLYVIPNSLTYTIACPQGLIWRSRALLTEPAPSLANPKVHYTFTPWPEEDVADDWYNTGEPADTGFEAPVPLAKNREFPWYGFSCGGYYGIQPTWNRWGGVVGDTNQKLRLWKLDTKTYTWNNHINLSLLLLLPQDINTTYPARIHGVGKTDFYNRFTNNPASDPFTQGFVVKNPAKTPITKNYEAWFVAAPWIVENFEKDILHPFDPPTRDPLIMGWKDAGLTINAISPENGEILAQYTIRASKDPDDALPTFVNNRRDLEIIKEKGNEQLEKSIDKYYNHNPDYFENGYPLEPYDGQNTVISGNFATVPWDSGFIYRLYGRITGFNEGADRVLNYPGMPSFPSLNYDLNSVFTDYPVVKWNNYSQPQYNSDLNNPQQPNIILDEDNNLYFCLYMPYWRRWQDIFTPGGNAFGQVAERSNSTTFTIGGESTQSSIRVNVFFDGNLCDGHVSIKVNGQPYGGHNYPGFYTGYLVPYTAESVTLGGTFNGHYVEGTENPETGYPGHPLFSYEDTYVIEATWFQPIVTDYDEILLSNQSFEYPTFIGFQATPLPTKGLAINNFVAEVSPDYITTHKPFLFKLTYDKTAKTLTEKWRKDLSRPTNFRSNTYVSYDENIETLALSNLDTESVTNWTLVCGRYIFVIQDLVQVTPTATTSVDQSAKKSVLLVFHNSNEEPTVFKEIDLPNTVTSTNPVVTHQTIHATCNVDSRGRENLFLKMKNGRGFSILFPATEGDDPDIQSQLYHATEGEPDFPETGFDSMTMGSAGSSYYWLDPGNNVKRKLVEES